MIDEQLLRIIQQTIRGKQPMAIFLDGDGFWATIPISRELLASEEEDATVTGPMLMAMYRDARKISAQLARENRERR